MFFRCWFTVFLVLLLQVPGVAASFDCTKAATSREKLICSSSALSDLDAQLGQRYKEKRGLLSPHGAEMLLGSQQRWLRHIAQICPVDNPKKDASAEEPEICLKSEYSDRIEELGKIARVGPFIFNRIDLFLFKPMEGGGGQSWHVAFPQIDNADTPVSQAWNKHVEKSIVSSSDCESGGREDTDYSLGYANDRLISITWTDSTYCTGTPHGFGGSHGETLVLAPTLHPLDAAELFNPEGRAELRALFWKNLQGQGWQSPSDAAKEGLLDKAVDPRNWLFTKEGIQAVFSSYDGGCFACTPREPVMVTWTNLKPFLLPTSPLP